ncbi:MAG: AzlD domain-containing protein [Alsobacter sp.]
MSIDPQTLLAIAAMSAVTYATRAAGLLIAHRLALTGRLKVAFDEIPAAVLTAVIAPTVLATGWPETVAALLTMLVAFRLPLLGTVAVGVIAVVLLRGVAG